MTKILIVDDRPVNRQFLTTLLRYKSYETREACDGIEALTQVAEWRPNLAIVDLRMPRMDGQEFVNELRKHADPSLASTPVVFYTATYKEVEARSIAAACGVDLVLTKPAAPEVILDTIEAALGRQRVPSKDTERDAFAELHHAQARLSVLGELSIDLASEHDADLVLQKLTRAARKIVGADGALLCICGEEHTRHATSGRIAEVLADGLHGGRELCTLCRGSLEPTVIFENASLDGDVIGACLPPEERGRPYLSIPMTFSSARRGVLVLIGSPGAAPFTEEDGSLALTLTMQGSLTFENAALYGNLTEARRVLEQRVEERTRELSEVNQELESFSYSVSHDLRAPLRAINGFAGILLANHSEQLDEKARGYLGRVCAAADRMAELIDDLLTLSRCVRAAVVKTRVDVTALAQEIVRELTAASPDRRVDVAVEEGLFVHADGKLLRVILTNLLGNAWKFTGSRERASIGLERCANGDDDAFVIRDNGVGFDMSSAANLFAPFQRFHSSREFEGTGIGLATVQRLVHRHGGRVWMESAPERGTAFFVALPKGGQS
jgi:signal transduction histidine kinase/CheY-like chemotaxis protein